MKAYICIILAIFILALANAPIAAEENGDWEECINYTLYWGDSIDVNGSLITAHDFSKAKPFDIDTDYVMLTILSESSEEWNAMLSINNSDLPDSKIIEGRLNITALEVVTGDDIPISYAKIGVSIFNVTETEADSWVNKTLQVSKTKLKNANIDERAYITIQLHNLRGSNIEDISINETLPENLILDPEIEDIHITDLSPYSKEVIQYSVKALYPGNYTIPPTEIRFVNKGITYFQYSNSTNLIVHGPYINATKTIKINETDPEALDFTVNVKNEGDRAAHIRAHDEMITDSKFIEGKTSANLVLFPENTTILSYSVHMNSIHAYMIVPSAVIEFTDAKGYSGTVRTNRYYLNDVFENGELDFIEEYDDDTRAQMNTSNSNSKDRIVEADIPRYGNIRSVRDLVDTTLEIINEALSF
ncbi:hypothetical protein [Methanococcoides alaskense]|uniref:DUF11 domain-containing protein n=1 Tax=Methanococcoides alaskense TaxID=325778 RepID=A0AA90TZH4_9EURY|nr:hypothetical protein [Methanococcoides alaskense]MDA0525622.1 hypothetical protein [Methanococcoides alaskense]MDR6222842.1 hypothetical protein [Methanococcoides alaskense]